MDIILHLQNLPEVATNIDVRNFFVGLDIPVGGVHMLGGEDGDTFIKFSSEKDLLKAFNFDDQLLLGQRVKLFLAKEIDVQCILEKRDRELDRVKANFLSDSSRKAHAHDVESFHDLVQHSGSHRADADEQEQPFSSHPTYADKDDHFSVQDPLSSNYKAYPDKDEKFQDQDLSHSSDKRYAEENKRYPDEVLPPQYFPSDDSSLDPSNIFDQAVIQRLEKKSSRSTSSCEKYGQYNSSIDKSGQVQSHSEEHSGDYSRKIHHSSRSDNELKKEKTPEFEMSLPSYAVAARRDLEKNPEEANAEKQKPASTELVDVPPWLKQPRSDGLDIVNSADCHERHRGDGRSRDRDEEPRGHQDSCERDSTKGKHNSTESDKTRGRRNSRERESLRSRRSSPDSNSTTDHLDRSKDKDKRSHGKGVKPCTASKKVRKRERDHSRDRGSSSSMSREDNPHDKKRETSGQISRKVRRSSRDRENNSARRHQSGEHKDQILDCIGLYNLDVTVTATDIRKFLGLWEIPDGGIIMRTDKFDPNTILAYITYYQKGNVRVKSLIGTSLHGRPVEINSVPLELFNREKISDKMIEETPPSAPVMGYPNYRPPHPGMYPGPMWMPQMRMPGHGPPPGMMGPWPGMRPPGMMPHGGMGIPPRMPPPFPRPQFPGYENAQGQGCPDAYTLSGMMALHFIRLNKSALPDSCSACEVWSWFGGLHGPTEYTIIVTDRKHVPVAAYVAFLDEHQRDKQIAKSKENKDSARTHYKVDWELREFCMLNPRIILQSTKSGVDTNITAEIHYNLDPDRHKQNSQNDRQRTRSRSTERRRSRSKERRRSRSPERRRARSPERRRSRSPERRRSRSPERRRSRSPERRRARSRDRRRTISPVRHTYRMPRPHEERNSHENRNKRSGSISSALNQDSQDEMEKKEARKVEKKRIKKKKVKRKDDEKVVRKNDKKVERKDDKKVVRKDDEKVERKDDKKVKRKDDKKGIKKVEK